MPTPPGVPVAMTSPGSRVMIVLRSATISAGPNTSWSVLDDCLVTPSTVQLTSRPRPSPISSTVTSAGPTGVDPSKVLPARNCVVRVCQSRIDTSLSTVKPAMAPSASSGPALRTSRPMTTANSTSQSALVDTSGGGSRIGSKGPVSARRYLAK